VKDLGTHLFLFVLVSAAFVVIAAFYSEATDGPALRSVPRRLIMFLLGCAVLAGVMLLVEHTLASVS